MKLKFIFFVVFLMPTFASADETPPSNDASYVIAECDKQNEFRLAYDVSRQPNRIKLSIYKQIEEKYSKQGSTITFRIPDDTATVEVTQEERKSRVSNEFAKIINSVQKKSAKSADGDKLRAASTPPTDTFKCVRVVQEYDRSNIAIAARSATDKSVEKTFIAGPVEHWYFSADVPLTSTKQINYDAKTASYETKDTPSSFYASLNFKIGDALDNPKDFEVSFSRISLKPLMVKVNGPTESYGVGMSYDFGPAILFAARVKTKNDPSASDAPISGVYSTIYGISFDIDHGFSWLSSK